MFLPHIFPKRYLGGGTFTKLKKSWQTDTNTLQKST